MMIHDEKFGHMNGTKKKITDHQNPKVFFGKLYTGSSL